MAQGKTTPITKQKRVNSTTGKVEDITVSSTSVGVDVVDGGLVPQDSVRNLGVVTGAEHV